MRILVLKHPPEERRSHHECYSCYSPVQQAQISIITWDFFFPILHTANQAKPSSSEDLSRPRGTASRKENISENISENIPPSAAGNQPRWPWFAGRGEQKALLSLAHHHQAAISTSHVQVSHRAELCLAPVTIPTFSRCHQWAEQTCRFASHSLHSFSSAKTSQLPQHLLRGSYKQDLIYLQETHGPFQSNDAAPGRGSTERMERIFSCFILITHRTRGKHTAHSSLLFWWQQDLHSWPSLVWIKEK